MNILIESNKININPLTLGVLRPIKDGPVESHFLLERIKGYESFLPIVRRIIPFGVGPELDQKFLAGRDNEKGWHGSAVDANRGRLNFAPVYDLDMIGILSTMAKRVLLKSEV